MTKINTGYLVLKLLLSAFILLGAFIDISANADAIEFFRHLGYPEYLPRFLGTLKVLGIIAIWVALL